MIQKIVLNQLGNLRLAQMTIAAPSVEIGFNQFPLLASILDLRKSLPLGTECPWKTVGEMKRDELDPVRFIAMWQITTLVPSAKAPLGVGDLRR